MLIGSKIDKFMLKENVNARKHHALQVSINHIKLHTFSHSRMVRKFKLPSVVAVIGANVNAKQLCDSVRCALVKTISLRWVEKQIHNAIYFSGNILGLKSEIVF